MATSKDRQVGSFYERLTTYTSKHKYSKAVIVCDKILKAEEAPAKLRQVLRAKCVLLIWQGKTDAALALAEEHQFLYERAYCLYKNKQTDEALQQLSALPEQGTALAERHLKAQLLYRLGKYDDACEIYETILAQASPAELTGELLSNYCAAQVLSGGPNRFLDLVEQHKAKLDAKGNYELVFNTACAMLAANDTKRAVEYLDRAIAHGNAFLETDDLIPAEEIASELAPLSIQKAFALLRLDAATGDYSEEARQLLLDALAANPQDQAAAAVAANNLLAQRGDHELFDSYKRMRGVATPDAVAKLPLPYERTVWFNKALLLLKMQKGVECRELVADLEKRFPDSDQPKLIEVALLLKEKKAPKAVELLETLCKDTASRADGGGPFVLALAQIYLSRGEREAVLKTLTSAPPSATCTPAVARAVAALHLADGKSGEALAFLSKAVDLAQSTEHPDRLQLALLHGDVLLNAGEVDKAAELFDNVMNGKLGEVDPEMRMSALASFVVAQSWSNVDASETKAKVLPPPPGVDSIDVAALNAGTALRQRRPKVNPSAAPAGAAPEEGLGRATPSKSVDAAALKARKAATKSKKLAKRRAKRRDAYLAKLAEKHGEGFDPAKHNKPDAERWVPKPMREKERKLRAKRGAKLTGAQGSGDHAGRQAARLDIHSQDAAARDAPASSSNSKKGKKGRR